MNPTTANSTFLYRLVALMAVVAILASACAGDSGDTDDATDGAIGEIVGDDRSDADEEADFVPEPIEKPAEEPASEPVAPQGATDAEAPAAEEESASAGGTSGELFAPEPPPVDRDDEEARFDDNTFEDYGQRVFIDADDDPLSTFALDVDTGSFTVARRWIEEGALPPRESVRPEEYINAIRYDYDAPRRGLDVEIEGAPSPFDGDNVLVRIGVSSEVVEDSERPPVALTFVVDTSGSMDRGDRLGLVKESLGILVDELDDDDTVAIVTYSNSSGIVLFPTPVSERGEILDAIDDLQPGGSTNLEAGLREGYELAREAFREDGINRVVLASDGVANVGVTDPDQLARMIRDDADAGINLVTVGFGMGNFNDVTMEQLADQGDGFYAYVDTDDEAERLFQDELTATLVTVAKDAKIQVEFDPEIVDEYRLIGFENRGVRDSDFRNDEVDAGEIGAGHQVTAIYEIKLRAGVELSDRDEIGVVFLRWEDPDSGEVDEIDEDIDLRDVEESWDDTSDSLRTATVLAAFAEIMRGSEFATDFDLDDVAEAAAELADLTGDRDIDALADMIDDASRLR
jgi:Ca-activated chloride channel family protein